MLLEIIQKLEIMNSFRKRNAESREICLDLFFKMGSGANPQGAARGEAGWESEAHRGFNETRFPGMGPQLAIGTRNDYGNLLHPGVRVTPLGAIWRRRAWGKLLRKRRLADDWDRDKAKTRRIYARFANRLDRLKAKACSRRRQKETATPYRSLRFLRLCAVLAHQHERRSFSRARISVDAQSQYRQGSADLAAPRDSLQAVPRSLSAALPYPYIDRRSRGCPPDPLVFLAHHERAER